MELCSLDCLEVKYFPFLTSVLPDPSLLPEHMLQVSDDVVLTMHSWLVIVEWFEVVVRRGVVNLLLSLLALFGILFLRRGLTPELLLLFKAVVHCAGTLSVFFRCPLLSMEPLDNEDVYSSRKYNWVWASIGASIYYNMSYGNQW